MQRRGALLVAALTLTAGTTAAVVAGGADPSPPAGPVPAPGPPPAPAVLLPVGSDAPVPVPSALAQRLDPLLDAAPLRRGVGAAVLDPVTGAPLYEREAGEGRIPASVTKLMTGAAALSALGPATRLQTRVAAGPAPGEVVLVGGGDPTLTIDGRGGSASLSELARATARQLRAAAPTPPLVSVLVDATLFAGPPVSPDWRPGYVPAVVAPVSALRLDPAAHGPGGGRGADPAVETGRRFAELLRREGLEVSGRVRGAPVPPGAPTLAAVSGPPVALLVERALVRSDNDLAEALARLVAVRRGAPADFAGASGAITAVVAGLGVPVEGMRLLDGSGLARGARVPPLALARLLAAAGSATHPELRALLTGLPVAGFTGTLVERYAAPPTAAGAGLVRAKTGTLTGVSALAGTVRDADGRVLVFVLIADRVPAADTSPARAGLDRAAAALASCGCS